MVKITVNENLVPSSHPFVKGSPYSDLTYNVLLARKLIRIAQVTFLLNKGAATFSGYINEFPDGDFKLTIYEKGVQIRSARLRDLRFSGELDIDVEDFSEAVGQDLVSDLGVLSGLGIVAAAS
jgi:hypothetical protein